MKRRRRTITKRQACGILSVIARTGTARERIASVARLSAMLGWDAPTRVALTQEEATFELARMLGCSVDELLTQTQH
jgi:hypothetical protein